MTLKNTWTEMDNNITQKLYFWCRGVGLTWIKQLRATEEFHESRQFLVLHLKPNFFPSRFHIYYII